MSLPDFAIEAKGLVKPYAATKTGPAKTALRGVALGGAGGLRNLEAAHAEEDVK